MTIKITNQKRNIVKNEIQRFYQKSHFQCGSLLHLNFAYETQCFDSSYRISKLN